MTNTGPQRVVRRFYAAALASLAVIAFAGCPSLATVNEFATAGQQTTAAFPSIGKDFPASCLRAESYDQELQFDTAHGTYKIADIPPADLAARDTSAACADIAHNDSAVLAANDVLGAYLKALARLSDNKLVNYDSSLDTLAKRIETAAKLTDSVKAASGLASWLGDALTRGYRQNKLKSVIVQNDSAVQLVTAGLRRYAADYDTLLAIETGRLDRLYRGALSLDHGRNAPAAVLLLTDYRAKLDAIATKREAADAYRSALTKIAAGHKQLSRATKLTSKEVESTLASYANGLAPLIQKMRKTF